MNTKQSSITRGRATGGFTLMEMMAAVAILVILMGVAFVSVISHQRSMKQLELDGTAKEILIAAQNHLTMAQNQGILKDAKDDEATVGVQDGSSSTIRYWYVGDDKSQLSTANKSLLYEMLPFASIDETVRLGGSYVIQYDLDTGTVMNVFYSDQKNLSEHEFTSADQDKLFYDMVGDGDEAKKARLDGSADGFDGQIIGWYGAESLNNSEQKKLYAPAIKLTNADRLMVTATLSTQARQDNSKVDESYLRIVMRGDTSKHSVVVANKEIATIGANGTKGYQVTCVLDDITDVFLEDDGIRNPGTVSRHFAEQWCQSGSSKLQATRESESGPLIPGENISIYAEVYSNAALSNIARSATRHTNSLFARIIEEKKGDAKDATTNVATISNIRHLENLDGEISGYDLKRLGKDGATTARQIADLRWASTTSTKPPAFTSAIVEDATTTIDASDVRVLYRDGSQSLSGIAPKAGTFVPVTPRAFQDSTSYPTPFVLTYKGNNKKISDVKVDVEGTANAPAGIFATVESGSSIENLELIDCSVATANGSAGTLLGAADGNLTLKNVIAHDSTGAVKSKVLGTTAGGLVGSLIAASGAEITVDGCAAATYVESTGADGHAGGFVGQTNGNVTIENSYVGGHTKDGMYDPDDINVKASNVAGGFVGSASSATIQNCYTTASVTSNNALGGFAGTTTGGSINTCYATGLVKLDDTRQQAADAAASGANVAADYGTFVGTNSNTTLGNDRYYGIINGTMGPVANLADDNVVSFDEPELNADGTVTDAVTVFNNFYANGEQEQTLRASYETAHPYDSELSKRYDNKYNLRTVAMLTMLGNKEAADQDSEWVKSHPWVTSHYGDWPSPETLVINTPTS